MKKLLQNNIQGKRVLLLFILTIIVYGIMLLVTIPKVMSHSKGMKVMDMLPTGYDLDYVNTLLSTLGEEGRMVYLYQQIPIDMIYPGLFAISFCIILAYFLNKMDKLKSPFIYLCLLPVIGGTFDYLENFGIISLLKSYPNLSETTVSLTNLFTLLKSWATTIYFGILMITIIFWGINVLKKS